MAKRWIIAALIACCLAPTTVQAQWGFNGLDVDPRYDPNVAGNGAAEATMSVPGLDLTGGYLTWWLRDPKLSIPIVTGANGTPVLIGPDTFGYDDPFSGGQLRARYWIDNTQTGSIEAGGFILGERSSTAFALPGPSVPVVAIPGNLLFPPGPVFIIFGQFGEISGGVVASSSAFLWGADACLVVNTLTPLETFAGFRYIDLSEDLNITTRIIVTENSTDETYFDQFHTRNQFYGGQMGLRAAYRYGLVTFAGLGRLSLGSMHETIDISGSSTIVNLTNPAEPPRALATGRFANPGNAGRYTREKFAVVSEVEGRLSIDITAGVQAFFAYNFMYINEVVRPGNQFAPISGVLGAPTVPFSDTYFWAHGITAGLSVRY